LIVNFKAWKFFKTLWGMWPKYMPLWKNTIKDYFSCALICIFSLEFRECTYWAHHWMKMIFWCTISNDDLIKSNLTNELQLFHCLCVSLVDCENPLTWMVCMAWTWPPNDFIFFGILSVCGNILSVIISLCQSKLGNEMPCDGC
jgi:hypothetical protein